MASIKRPSSQGLKAGTLGLGDVFIQALTHTAPATAVLFTVPFIALNAGVTAPLSYLVAFFLIIILGITLTQLAKHLPSAGVYYTYISHTISPRAGFITSWLYFLYDPVIAGYSLTYMGYILQESLRQAYGIVFPWPVFLVLVGTLVILASYRGIEISAKLLIILGLSEIVIVLLLSVWSLFRPGDGGINVSSFIPSKAPSLGGSALGVVFSIFALAGWEGVAPLAEESRSPKKTLPRAIMYSILFMGLFLVFTSWCMLVGWGTNHIQSFVEAKENPTFMLARKFWGHGWVLLLIALVNSMIAVSIACNNSATRVWYAMARSGSLPRFLSTVHPIFQTPTNAVFLQGGVMFAVGLGLGYIIGPQLVFDFMGVVITFSLAVIYTMGNIGVMRFYLTKRRDEFNWLLHLAFPIIGISALGWVVYASLNPWPKPPIGYAFWVVAIWLVLGLIVLISMKILKKEEWMLNAGNASHNG